MTTESFVLAVLGVAAKYDLHGDLFWRTDGEYAPIRFWINCNDLFWWATSDAEAITAESLPELVRAMEDTIAVETDQVERVHGPSLYCARQRQMRPQGACYKHFPKTVWPLFDACGPERERDGLPFGNPVAQSAVV